MNAIICSEICNAILVHHKVRPSFLIQPCDHNETNEEKPVVNEIVNKIKKIYPHFIFTLGTQGVLVSTEPYSAEEIEHELGKVLGYPCYFDFDTLDKDKVFYEYRVIAKCVLDESPFECELFVNFCKDRTHSEEFKNIVERSKILLTDESHEIIHEFMGARVIVTDVVMNVTAVLPVKDVVSKLVHKKPITDDERDRIEQSMYDSGFLIPISMFQLFNPVHRGILIGILHTVLHDRMEPFYPLDTNSPIYTSIMHVEERLIESIKQTLIDTTIRHFKRKTRRRRHKLILP